MTHQRSLPPGGPGRDPRGQVEEELAFHFQRTADALIQEGLSPAEAEAEALRRFGDVARYRNDLVKIEKRRRGMERLGAWVSTVLQGLGLAFRGIRRSPGFTVAVVATLALGIGANATVFRVVDRLLLSPPDHVVQPDRVKHVFLRRLGIDGARFDSRWLTFPDYQDLKSVAAFQSVGGYTQPATVTLGSGRDAERVTAVKASASLFPLLGVRPALGRFYGPREDAVGVPGTVVLSYGFWQRRFGGDPGVLGHELAIGDGRYAVVGVAPEGFTGAEIQRVDVWLPLETAQSIQNGTGWREGENARNWWWMFAVARLAPGASVQQADAQATAIHRGARADLQDYDPEARILTASVIAGQGLEAPAEARVSRWLAGVSLIVLLVACANVANLLMARAVNQEGDLAVRQALGIGWGRLTIQLLVEALVLTALGAVVALLLARWSQTFVQRELLPDVALGGGALSPKLLAFTGVMTLITTLLAGILPSLRATGRNVGEVLKAGGRGVSGGASRVRTGLLVLQAALSVVLLVGAGLFVRSLAGARSMDLGFDPEGLVLARVEWARPTSSDAGSATMRERADAYELAVREIEALPSVASVATTYSGPFWSSISLGRPLLEGGDTVLRPPSGGPYINLVGPGYFRTMGLDILRGRPLEEADYALGAPPVTVVTESMARAAWPDGQAVGQCLYIPLREGPSPCTRVVGVVENHRRNELVEDDPHFMYFVTGTQPGLTAPPQGLVIRARGGRPFESATVQRKIRSLDDRIRFVQVRSYREIIDPMLRSWRLGATMFVVFGLLALLVATLGLYSLLAFDVAQRRRELGLRAALGADGRTLLRMILGRAVLLVAIGTGLGLTAALILGPFVRDLLFRVSPDDPLVLAGVAGTLLLVGVLGGALPARRATRIDPMKALRVE